LPRLGWLEARLGRLEILPGRLEARLGRLEILPGRLETLLGWLEARLGRLERRLHGRHRPGRLHSAGLPRTGLPRVGLLRAGLLRARPLRAGPLCGLSRLRSRLGLDRVRLLRFRLPVGSGGGGRRAHRLGWFGAHCLPPRSCQRPAHSSMHCYQPSGDNGSLAVIVHQIPDFTPASYTQGGTATDRATVNRNTTVNGVRRS